MSIRKVHPLAAAVAVAVATLAPGAASAQTASASGSTFATVTRELDLFASTTVMYDSNIARGRSVGTSRGLVKDDVRISPTAQINVSLPAGPAAFTLTGTAGYNFYLRNKELDREAIDLTGTAGIDAGPCAAFAVARYTRLQSDLVDLSIDSNADEDSSVNLQKVMRIDGTVSCGAQVGLRPTVFGGYRTSDNSAEARLIQNFHSTTYGGGLSYSSPTFGIVTAFIGRSEVEYVERERFALFFTGTPAFQTMRYGARFDRRLGARLQVNGEVSYVDVDLPAGFGAGTSFNGMNWDLAASYRAGPSLQLSAQVARVVDASGGYDSNLARTSIYSLRGTYALSEPLRLSLAATHRTRDFQVALMSPALLITDDEFDDVSATLGYQRRRLGVNFSVSYQTRDASIALYDYSAVRGSITVGFRL